MKALIFLLILTMTFSIKMKKANKKLGYCDRQKNGKSCTKGSDCDSRYCRNNVCEGTKNLGASCRCDGECESDNCSGNLWGLIGKKGNCA